ncbi:putative diphthamide synthesis protein-domain-containing protein [Phakopsora pachyrhizi]|nr:putative diphthamide synthesis protein-domain-containing protein [Phakopsora pachyrhizi]
MSRGSDGVDDGSIEDDVFQIDETLDWISSNHYRIVGLQFPDSLLPISVKLFKSLRSRHSSSDDLELYLMADTSYGSCCVDEVAARHVNAQAIIHYGNACLNTTSQLPVLYVLPRLPISNQTVELVSNQLVQTFLRFVSLSEDRSTEPHEVYVMYDLGYHWKIGQIVESLRKHSNFNLTVNSVKTQQDKIDKKNLEKIFEPNASILLKSQTACQTSNPTCENASQCCMNINKSTLNDYSPPSEDQANSLNNPREEVIDLSRFQAVFYIGGESSRLTHFLVTNPNLPVLAIDPSNDSIRFSECCQLQTERTNKLLMRRYATIQRARDSDVFGILIGTMGISNYLELIDQTRRLIEKTFKKKAYIVSVGKLKPEKLMNFSEIECWVLIDCPENSLLMLDHQEGSGPSYDPKLYRIPIISPWELEIALSSCIEEDEDDYLSGDEAMSKARRSGRRRRREWEGRLVLDFERLLNTWRSEKSLEEVEKGKSSSNETQDGVEENAPVYSMVTGSYKYRRNWNTLPKTVDKRDELGLVLKDSKTELIEYVGGAASEYAMRNRTYQGLEARVGLDEPSIMEVGRFGIAQGYGDDHPAGSDKQK